MLRDARLLSKMDIVALDVETTGLYPFTGDRVVELAAVKYRDGRVIDTLNHLVFPERKMDRGASAVNGIVDAYLVGKPLFVHLARKLTSFVGDALVVAHNAPFDAAFLSMEYFIAKIEPFLNPWACTLELARNYFYFSKNDLETVALEMGIDFVGDNMHRALYDAQLTGHVFHAMLGDPRVKGMVQPKTTVGDLVGLFAAPISLEYPLKMWDVIATIADSLNEGGYKLRIWYQGTDGSVSERVVKPAYPSENGGTLYLIADCELRQDRRTFRLDRILKAVIA